MASILTSPTHADALMNCSKEKGERKKHAEDSMGGKDYRKIGQFPFYAVKGGRKVFFPGYGNRDQLPYREKESMDLSNFYGKRDGLKR